MGKRETKGVMKHPEDRSYFFDEGLAFHCTGCGKCCTGEPGRVQVTSLEVGALARALGCPEAAFRSDYVVDRGGVPSLRERDDGSCILYDGGCRVYAHRPAQCRTYPFWMKNLRTPEAWQEAAKECPGIGLGRTHTRRAILEMLQESPI